MFAHSVKVALKAELIGLVLHALDGTKMQAAVVNLSERLEYTHTRWHSGKGESLRCYRCRRRDCPVRTQCSKDGKGRKIELGKHHAALQRQRDTLRDSDARAKLAKRRYIANSRTRQSQPGSPGILGRSLLASR